MGGFDHQPAGPDESEGVATSARNAHLGLWLFLVYLAFYAGFVLVNAFRPAWMEQTLAGGVNLAVWYGLALIVAAFLLALAYGWMCRAPLAETKTNTHSNTKTHGGQEGTR